MGLEALSFVSVLPTLLAASRVTIGVAIVSMMLALFGGILLTLLRALKWPLLSLAICVLRSAIFGVPLLVLVFIAYYVLPAIGLNLDPLTAGILAIATSSAFFISEVFRGGLATIASGQVEAAESLGLGALCIWLRVVLPQMVRASIPFLVNEFTILVKATALLSVITVTELMRRAQQIYAVNYRPFETLLAAAVIYVAINLLASRAGALIERSTARMGR
jgi:polar amino acid transport system permease protein